MSDVDLVVAPCTYKAAKYAVMHWHYSKAMPVGKVVKFGAWENDKFAGCILFAWGSNKNIGKPYGIPMVEVCELVRVALTAHKSQVSQIVSRAMSELRKQSPGLRLIVSFADPEQKHNGTIYQAMNWIYSGMSASKTDFMHNGELLNRRAYTGNQFGILGSRAVLPDGATIKKSFGKHKYLYPLDKAMRRQIEPLAQPYPKRADVGEMESRAASSG